MRHISARYGGWWHIRNAFGAKGRCHLVDFSIVISGEFGFRTLNALIYKLLSRSKLVIWEALTSASGEK
jgi:hypothetical protein